MSSPAPEIDARLGQAAAPQGAGAALAAWRATRLPWGRFVPLALLLAWAASVGAPADPAAFLLRAVLALALVATLRLWDDLADRERDVACHPERVLARCTDLRVFVRACVLVGCAAAWGLHAWHGADALLGLAVLCAGLGAWYRVHRARGVLHAHVLLLKYPAIVALLAWPAAEAWILGCAAAAVYAAMCAFELVDRDPAPCLASRIALGLHAAVACAAAIGPNLDARGLAAGGLAALSILAGASFAGTAAVGPARRYVPFLAAVIVLVRHTLGESA